MGNEMSDKRRRRTMRPFERWIDVISNRIGQEVTERESFRKQKYSPRSARSAVPQEKQPLASGFSFNSRIVGHVCSLQRRSHEERPMSWQI